MEGGSFSIDFQKYKKSRTADQWVNEETKSNLQKDEKKKHTNGSKNYSRNVFQSKRKLTRIGGGREQKKKRKRISPINKCNQKEILEGTLIGTGN